MKPDVLTLTALVFVIGVLVSSFGITESSPEAPIQEAPSALQQGIAIR